MRQPLRVLRSGWRSMAAHPVRSCLMLLGPLAGVTAMIVLAALGRGAEGDILTRMNRMFNGSSILLRAGGNILRIGAHAPPATTLTLADIAAVDSALAVVALADPVQGAGEQEVIFGGRSRPARISGHSEGAEYAWRPVTRGAYFTAADVASAARVALVGEVVVAELFEGRNPIGEQIRIGAVPFQVIGVLEHAGIDPHGIDLDNEIFIPITTLMRRVRNVDYIAGAKFLVEPEANLDSVVSAAGEILRRRHGLGPGQPDDFAMYTPLQVTERIKETNRVFTVFLPLAAGVVLLIGGLVVANLMLLAVHERRAEIGIRRAVGARTRDIRLQFLLEGAAITGLGGLLAVALGLLIVMIPPRVSSAAAAMPWDAAALGVASAILVGVAAGVVPARRAAELDPVQTLR